MQTCRGLTGGKELKMPIVSGRGRGKYENGGASEGPLLVKAQKREIKEIAVFLEKA